MADVIAKLQVDSGQFDQKLKSAVEQMAKMEQEVRRTGATFAYADKEELEFVKSLGQMSTQSTSAIGKLNEMKKAFTDLSVMYQNLTDEEKQGKWGVALSESIEQLRGRFSELKTQLEGANNALEGSKEVTVSAKTQLRAYTDEITTLTQAYRAMSDEERNSDNGKALAASIDQLKGKAAELQDIMSDTNREIRNLASDTSFTDGLNLMTRTVGSCAAAITAWTGDSKEMEVVIKDLAKIGATVAAVDSLTKAFQKQNLVLLKNPYVAAAAAVVALGVAIGKLIQKSQELSAVEKALQDVQAKGRENAAKEVTRIKTLNNILHDNTRSMEERESALAQIQSLVPEYHGALTKEGELINDNTDVMNGYIDSLQRAALAQAAFDKMVEIQRTKMEKQLELQKAQKELEADQSIQSAGVPSGAAAFGGGGGMSMATAVAGTNNMAVKIAQDKVNDLGKEIEEFNKQLEALQELVKPSDLESTTTGKGGKTKGGGTTTITAATEPVEGTIAWQEKEVSRLRDLWKNAGDAVRDKYKKNLDAAQAVLDQMLGNTKEIQQVDQKIEFNAEGMSEVKKQLTDALNGSTFGSGDYLLAADQLLDFTTFENLLKTATENGLDISDTTFKGLFKGLKMGLEIPDAEWEKLVEQINEKLAELNLPPITLNVKTGAVAKTEQEVSSLTDNVNGAIIAFGQLGGAIQQIEDPSAKVAGIIMGAVAEVAASFASSLKGNFGTWDWIAAAIAGTATMISTIAAIKSATGGGGGSTSGNYASGGKIPGNSFSGDNMRGILPNGDLIGLDAGEIILNRAQQGVVAGAMQGNPMNDLNLSLEVEGTKALIWLNNTNRSLGGGRDFYTKRH